MNDREGNEVEIGDLIFDQYGDLSRVIGFDISDPEPTFRTIPVKKVSIIGTSFDGYWHIAPKFVVKVSSLEEATFLLLKGKV